MIRFVPQSSSGSLTQVIAPFALAMTAFCCASHAAAQATDPALDPTPRNPPVVVPPPDAQPAPVVIQGPSPGPRPLPPPPPPPPVAAAPAPVPEASSDHPPLGDQGHHDILFPAGHPGGDEKPPIPPLVLPGPADDANRARLDYSDGQFFLRSFDDNLVLFQGGRMHIDTYTFGGPGVDDFQRANGTGLKTNLFFRRFVLELGGIVRKKFFFWLGGNFAPTTIDAAGGASGAQASVSTANVYDGFIGYAPVPTLRIFLGQYNAPFTMENVTSSRWLDLMERSLTVRTVATPYNKADGLMVWGETENKMLEYQIGGFGGDGMNRPNIDNSFDGMGRIVFRPLAETKGPSNRLHVGVSGRFGWRDRHNVRYDAPGLSTPGGYTFWSPSFGSADNGGVNHIQPYRDQGAVGAELYIPFERFDLKGEFIYTTEGRREVAEANRSQTLRAGRFFGFGTYGQASFWLAGSPRLNGNPAGYYSPIKVPEGLGNQFEYGLQLVARVEFLRMNYDSDNRAGEAAANGKDSGTEHIQVNVYQLGLNLWATKHIRITAEYSLYQFPGTPRSGNQAVAPGVGVGHPQSDVLHELSFRLGLAL